MKSAKLGSRNVPCIQSVIDNLRCHIYTVALAAFFLSPPESIRQCIFPRPVNDSALTQYISRVTCLETRKRSVRLQKPHQKRPSRMAMLTTTLARKRGSPGIPKALRRWPPSTTSFSSVTHVCSFTVRAYSSYAAKSPTCDRRAGKAARIAAQPQNRSLSIAVSAAAIDNVQSHELATAMAGLIARTAAIFCVDEVIVIDESSSPK